MVFSLPIDCQNSGRINSPRANTWCCWRDVKQFSLWSGSVESTSVRTANADKLTKWNRFLFFAGPICRTKWNTKVSLWKRDILCAFGHLVATCWVLSAKLWKYLIEPTRTTQHVFRRAAKRAQNVATCCVVRVVMLESFSRGWSSGN